MEQIKQKILDYLSGENIVVVYFEDGSSDDYLYEQPTELAIKVEDNDLCKWDYFRKRVNSYDCDTCDTCDSYVVKAGHQDGTLKFTFNGANNNIEKALLEKNLNIFLECLKKKYYTVSPRVSDFSIIVKPTHRCNLDCKYCYDKPSRQIIQSDMSMETLDRIIYLLSNYCSKAHFIWHGGEPTMVGREWYIKAYEEVISKYPMLEFNFSLMSNGVNLNKQWMELFEKYKIHAGASYNYNHQTELRCSNQKNEDIQKEIKVSKKVEKVIKEYKLGVIEVITKANYKNMIDIYNFYKKNKINFSANHLFHTKQAKENGLEITAEEYVKEFLEFFKYWLYDNEGIGERTAEQFLKHVIGSREVTCEHQDCRRKWLGVNPIGELYACDRHFPRRYKTGTVFDFESLEDVFDGDIYQMYSCEVQKRFDTECKKCGYWFACRGGCNGSSIEASGNAEGIEEFVCELFRLKFNGVYDILRNVDLVHDKLNPVAKKIMVDKGFFSVKDIKEYMEENKGLFPQMEYDKENLLECSEYQIFRGINFVNDIGSSFSRHIDFYSSQDEDSISKTVNLRKSDLHNYLKEVAKNAISGSSQNTQCI